MSTRYKTQNSILLFILRNAALYFLMLNAFLHVSDILNPLYLSVAFVLTALTAVFLENLKLRFWTASIIALVLPFFLRMLAFFMFYGIQALIPGHETDLLFLFFDKDFFPFLAVYAVVWLFNFLARRYSHFVPIEVLLNTVFLIFIFWNQAFYHISLYPHPSYFALALLVFVLCEIFVLLTAGFIKERTQGGGKKLLVTLGYCALLVIPLFIVFYLVLQDYHEQSAKGFSGLMKPTLFQFDLSPYVQLQSEIELSDDLVLLMRTDGSKQKYLLRRYILSAYDPKRGFFREEKPPQEEQNVFLPDYAFDFPDPGFKARTRQLQEYYLVNFDTSALIALNYPVTSIPYKNWQGSSFTRVYRVISKVWDKYDIPLHPGTLSLWNSLIRRFTYSSLQRIRRAEMDKEQLDHYTEYGQDEQIQDLARTLTDNTEGYYEKVITIYEYLKHNYYYSLKPGISSGENQLHHFLFQVKKGYCSYFAFAMALLCRSIDIPARVVVGFYVGPYSEVPQFYHSGELLNFYEVRAYQAHAWVEVYFNQFGWIEFDPTSTTLAPGEDFDIFLGRTGDEADLRRLIEEILKNQKNLSESTTKRTEDETNLERLGKTFLRGIKIIFSYWYFFFPAVYIIIVLLFKYFPYILFLIIRKKTKKIKNLYAWSVNLVYGRAWVRVKEESLLEYAKRLQKEKKLKFLGFSEYYLKAVFSSGFNAKDFSKAKACYKEFITSYRNHTNILLRVLAILNPRFLWRNKL
ncbi:MAG: transglutaminase domain-containing protein [Spirochaetales bacterium]|nr:transglutaminase domain-containing protein [Spirochaetales bacterium]